MQNQKETPRKRAPAVLACTLGGLMLAQAGAVRAAEADAKPPEPKKGWESVAAVGVTLTRGNSENFLATLGITSSRKWSKDEILLGAAAGYGETTDQTTDNHITTDQYARAFGQWNHLFTEKFYGGIRLDGVYDNVAGINYRFTLSPLAGYYLFKNPKTFLAVEAGPSVVTEDLEGEDSTTYFALRFADRFEYKFSDRAKLWQTAAFIPQVDDFNNWVLTVEVGISAAISKTLDLRLVAQDEYDNVPAIGRKNNDFKLIAGIGYKF